MKPLACTVMASPSRNSARLNAYVHEPKQGQAKGDRYVMASGINGASPEHVEHQMRQNRKRWGKDAMRSVRVPWGTDKKTGEKLYRTAIEGEYVQAYHVIISYAREGKGALDPEDPTDQAEGHRVASELAKVLAGTNRRATIHTQIDGVTGCLHSHISIDSVDKVTGKSFDSSKVKHKVLVETTNEMLLGLGYEQVNEYHATAWERREKSEARGLLKHKMWDAEDFHTEPEPFSAIVLKQRVKALLADKSYTDFEGFCDLALEYGAAAEQMGGDGRGVVYTQLRANARDDDWITPSRSDRRKASTLGRFAMMDQIEAAIQRNIELAKEAEREASAPTPSRRAKPAQEPAPAKAAAKVEQPRQEPPKASETAVRDWLRELREFEAEVAAEGVVEEAEQEALATAPASPPSLATAPDLDLDGAQADESSLAAAPDDRSALAAAPAEPEPFRSRLWEFPSKTKSERETADKLAVLDEQMVAWREEGRLPEESVVKTYGMGEEKLTKCGDWFEPENERLLRARHEKLARANRLYESGDDLARQRAKVLRTAVAEGRYETATTVVPAPLTAAQRALQMIEEPDTAPTPDPNRNKDRQGGD